MAVWTIESFKKPCQTALWTQFIYNRLQFTTIYECAYFLQVTNLKFSINSLYWLLAGVDV
jgi:hypothetical protein